MRKIVLFGASFLSFGFFYAFFFLPPVLKPATAFLVGEDYYNGNDQTTEAGTYVLLPYHEMRDDTNDSTTVRNELPPGEPSWKS